jgi:hypothetical protein
MFLVWFSYLIVLCWFCHLFHFCSSDISCGCIVFLTWHWTACIMGNWTCKCATCFTPWPQLQYSCDLRPNVLVLVTPPNYVMKCEFVKGVNWKTSLFHFPSFLGFDNFANVLMHTLGPSHPTLVVSLS